MSSVKYLLLAPLLVMVGLTAWAQGPLSRFEVGGSVGGMNYIGDLNDQSMFGSVSLAGGVVARLNLDTRWSLTLGGTYGHIQGGNPDVDPLRNLSFRSYLAEGFLRAEFNFAPYGLGSGALKRATPYLFCGVGVYGYNPQASYTADGQQQWYDLQPLGTEGQGTSAYPDRQKYELVGVSMPFGIGYRWRISPSVHMTAEYGWRKTWNDYLDDVSTTYVGDEVLMGPGGGGSTSVIFSDRSGEVVPGYVNSPGLKRGDDSLDDWYAYFSVSLTFSAEVIFGWMRGKRCEL